MSKISQKDAVYSAITSVFSENHIAFSEGSNVQSMITGEIRSQVSQVLFAGFKSGSIEITGTGHSDDKLKNYVSGLISNWVRKDKRLNGGSKYSAKSPGSRVGSSDASLKAMRALLSTLTSDSDKKEVQSAINTRVTELQASKVKISIDTESLPTALKSFVK